MTFRKKQSSKVMIPARWVKDGIEEKMFYEIKEILQDQYPDSQVTNDGVIAWLINLGREKLRSEQE